MITTEILDNIKNFGKEDDGSYGDRCDISIVPIGDGWCNFCLFNELTGETTLVRRINDITQLENLYSAIMGQNIEYKIPIKTKTDELLEEMESEFLKVPDYNDTQYSFYTDCNSLKLWVPMNWRDFTFIHASIERKYYINAFEIDIALLGLHLSIDIYFNNKKE